MRVVVKSGTVFSLAMGVVLGLLGCGSPSSAESKVKTVTLATAKQDSVSASTMAEGTVVPSKIVNVTAKMGVNGIVDKVFVQVGDHVKAGQVLAHVNPDQQYLHISGADAATAQALAKYDLSKKPYIKEQVEEARLQWKADHQAVKVAQAHLDLISKGHPLEIRAAEAVLEEDLAKQKLAQANLNRAKELAGKELLPRADLEAAQAAYDVASAVVIQAQQGLAIAKHGTDSEAIEGAKASVEQMRLAELKSREQLNLVMKGGREEEVRMNAAAIREAQANANLGKMVLKDFIIRSPGDGVVIERNLNPGEMVDNSTAHSVTSAVMVNNPKSLFVLADPSSIQFRANVDQMFYQGLRVGSEASVRIEALPGRIFDGHVTQVQPAVSPIDATVDPKTGKSTSPLSFPIWISINDPARIVIPGQPGFATLKRDGGGLVIPQAAINQLTIGEGTVYVFQDGTVHLKSIKFEPASGGKAIVLSGLHSGDKVVVSDWSDLADGMTVQASN